MIYLNVNIYIYMNIHLNTVYIYISVPISKPPMAQFLRKGTRLRGSYKFRYISSAGSNQNTVKADNDAY